MEGKLDEHHSGELHRASAEAKAERIIAQELDVECAETDSVQRDFVAAMLWVHEAVMIAPLEPARGNQRQTRHLPLPRRAEERNGAQRRDDQQGGLFHRLRRSSQDALHPELPRFLPRPFRREGSG